MYYLRRLKFGFSKKPIPPAFCIADRNECLFSNVADWRDLYVDELGQFDWDLRPSIPDIKLISAIRKHVAFKKVQVRNLLFGSEAEAVFQYLNVLLAPQTHFDYADKKLITEENFEEVFLCLCMTI